MKKYADLMLDLFLSVVALFACQTLSADNLPGGEANGTKCGTSTVTWNANVVRSDSTIVLNTRWINVMGTITVASGKTLTIKMNESLTWDGHALIRTSNRTDLANGFNGNKTFSAADGTTGVRTLSTTSMFKVEEGANLVLKGSSTYYLGIKGRYGDMLGFIGEDGQSYTSSTIGSTMRIKDMTVPDVTVDGNTEKRAIEFKEGMINVAGSLAMTNVRLYDVWSNGFGAIFVPEINGNRQNLKYGTITMDDCHVLRCRANQGACLLIPAQIAYNSDGVAYGGQNTAESCAVTIRNSKMYHCHCSNLTNGGVLRTYGNAVARISLINSQIYQCSSASAGAAIYWNGHGTEDTEMVFSGCSFHRNYSADDGGALVLEGSFDFGGDTTRVYKNKSGSVGGGVCVNTYSGAVTSLQMSLDLNFTGKVKIYDNIAVSGGGLGIQLGSTTMPSGAKLIVNISGAKITGNSADNGGGIYYYCGLKESSGYDVQFHMGNGSVVSGNAATGDGGAMYFKKAVIENTVVATPKIYFNNGTISGNSGNNGGAVYVSGLEIQCSDTADGLIFKGNTARNNGGALYIMDGGSITMKKCTISGNTANGEDGGGRGDGGGVYLNNGDFTMTDGKISSNKCVSDGAGVLVNGGNMVVEGGTMDSNKAESYGGGIYVLNGSCTVRGGTFTSNQCKGRGGALYSKDSKVEISGGKFVGNLAAWKEEGDAGLDIDGRNGGAIACVASKVEAQGSYSLVFYGGTFQENKADRGGAVYAEMVNLLFDELDGTSVLMEKNEATNTGAAVAIYSGSSMTINGGQFLNNVSNNTAGAIHVNSVGGMVTLNGGTFTGNSCKTNGGVLNMTAGTCNIVGGTFSNNSTDKLGGAMYIAGSSCTVNGGYITGNTAENSGGGIYVKNGDLTMDGGEVSGNTASGKGTEKGGGGIFYHSGGTLTITGGKITGNTTSGNGGGIYFRDGTLDFSNGEISGNVAEYDPSESNTGRGGGLMAHYYSSDASITITGGSILSNKGYFGAGIYAYKSSLNITGGEIADNEATAQGGGIYNYGATITMDGGVITRNSATRGGGVALATVDAKMTFGNGLITWNRAIHKTTADKTAYQSESQGVGGGVYLKYGTFKFDGATQVGLYNNIADKAGDDLCANGNKVENGVGTSVTIPSVKDMNLSGYKSKTSELYWVEDYMTGDTGYDKGTAVAGEGHSAQRYRDVVAAQGEVHVVNVPADGKTFEDQYVCLSLGHEIIYITLVRKGLLSGENAMFNIYRYDGTDDESDDVWTHYATVLLQGTADAAAAETSEVRKRFSLYSGRWKVVETPWAWSYDRNESAVVREITGASDEEAKIFVFDAPKLSSDKAGWLPAENYDEAVKVNRFQNQ